MRLIFVNRFFYPDHSATSQMLSDLAFGLSARGYDVTVITSRLRYDGQGEKFPAHETLNGVTVKRIPTTSFGRGALLGRGLDYLTFYLSVTWALLAHVRRGDLVIAKTDPPMLSVVAAPIVWIKRARLVNWLQDIFPEVAQALGVGRGRLSRIALKAISRLRDLTLRRAYLNIVLGTRMAEKLITLGVLPKQIRIIANWSDGTLIHPIPREKNSLRRDWALNDAFVVGYSGNLGRAHDIDTLITAISLLEQQSSTQKAHCIKWVFIGGGAQTHRLREEVARRQLTSVQFRPYQPRQQLAQSLSVADVHLISLQPELEGLIVPSKYYGIAAAGRAAIFIGESDGEIARILRDSKTGFNVAQGDGNALADTIKMLANDSVLVRSKGERARRLFEKNFEVRYALNAWAALITELQEHGN